MTEPKDLKLKGPLFLMNVKEDSTIAELAKQLDTISEETVAGLEALKVQADKLHNTAEEKSKMVWDAIEARLIETNKLPSGYNNEKHGFSISKHDQMFMEQREEEHNPLEAMLRGIARKAKEAGADVKFDKMELN